MLDLIQTNWVAFAAVLAVALLIAGWLLRRATSAPRVREHRPDVLDEGQAPAQRNQALIDAAPAAQIVTPPPFSGAMAGLGEVIAVTAQDEVEELEARAAEMEVVPEVEEVPEPAPAPAPAPEPEPSVARAPVPEPQPSPVPKPAVVAAPAAPLPAPPAQPRTEPASALAEAPAPQPSAPAPTPPRAEPVAAPAGPAPTPAPAPTPTPARPEPVEGHAPTPAPAAAPASSGGADDLSRIKGLGPKLQALLPSLGITTFAQIAALSDADLDALDPLLGPFAGRPRRDSWVEQAGYLASGDVAGFEAKFGKV